MNDFFGLLNQMLPQGYVQNAQGCWERIGYPAQAPNLLAAIIQAPIDHANLAWKAKGFSQKYLDAMLDVELGTYGGER